MKRNKTNKSHVLKGIVAKWFVIFSCLLILSLCTACTETPAEEKEEESDIVVDTPASTGISSQVFETEQGWGYDIFRNGKRYIHQNAKPAVGGNKGFETQIQAQKVAELVMHKINQGIAPPSVTAGEVDSLIQLYNK